MAVSVTVKVPSAAYVCVGFWAVLVCPSPKAQLYETAFPEVLVNETVAPLTELVNPALFGPGLAVI